MSFTKKVAKRGETVLHCGHVHQSSGNHVIVLCEACFKLYIADSAICSKGQEKSEPSDKES